MQLDLKWLVAALFTNQHFAAEECIAYFPFAEGGAEIVVEVYSRPDDFAAAGAAHCNPITAFGGAFSALKHAGDSIENTHLHIVYIGKGCEGSPP